MMRRASWPTVRLEEVCKHITVGHVGPMVNEYVSSGVPFLRSQNVRPFRFDPTELKYISPAFHAKLRKSALRPMDVVVTRSGANTGQCCMIPPQLAEANCSDLVIIRPSQQINPWYLMYVLNSDWGRATIAGGVVGAAQHHFNIGVARIFPIRLPPLHIQQQIAGILSAYDELIENSQRRIKILESMARALYREALGTGAESAASRLVVDSPYWRFISENVSNYAGTKRYYATADIDGLEVTGPGIDYSYAEKPSRAQKQPIPNSVWFARMKETYKIVWYGPLNDERVSGMILSSGFAGFEAKDAELWPLLFLTISSREFHVQKNLYCTGATQMSLTNEGLARIMLPHPDEQTARRLGRTVQPMLNAIAGLQRRNENLRRTRDVLLPRLLSGQIAMEAIAR